MDLSLNNIVLGEYIFYRRPFRSLSVSKDAYVIAWFEWDFTNVPTPLGMAPQICTPTLQLDIFHLDMLINLGYVLRSIQRS